MHDDVPVLLGHNWNGGVTGDVRIGQVFTSTLAAGYYSRVETAGAEILFDKSGNIHCCPTAHLVVRLTAPQGYVFAETGRRCGTGLVEIFSWEGYRTMPADEFESWREMLSE